MPTNDVDRFRSDIEKVRESETFTTEFSNYLKEFKTRDGTYNGLTMTKEEKVCWDIYMGKVKEDDQETYTYDLKEFEPKDLIDVKKDSTISFIAGSPEALVRTETRFDRIMKAEEGGLQIVSHEFASNKKYNFVKSKAKETFLGVPYAQVKEEVNKELKERKLDLETGKPLETPTQDNEKESDLGDEKTGGGNVLEVEEHSSSRENGLGDDRTIVGSIKQVTEAEVSQTRQEHPEIAGERQYSKDELTRIERSDPEAEFEDDINKENNEREG